MNRQIVGKSYEASSLYGLLRTLDAQNLVMIQNALANDISPDEVSLYVGLSVGNMAQGPDRHPLIRAVRFRPHLIQFVHEDIPQAIAATEVAIGNKAVRADNDRNADRDRVKKEIEFPELRDRAPRHGFTFFSLAGLRPLAKYSTDMVFSGSFQQFGLAKIIGGPAYDGRNYFNVKVESGLENPLPAHFWDGLTDNTNVAVVQLQDEEAIGLPAMHQGQPCPPIWEPPVEIFSSAMFYLPVLNRISLDMQTESGFRVTIAGDPDDVSMDLGDYQYLLHLSYFNFARQELQALGILP